MSIRVRFAPSPTGHLHIGGARTALFNWLLARQKGGTYVLRIEDTDRARSTAENEAEILRDLRWLGLDWDEGPEVGGPYGPYRQTDRMERYAEVVQQLIAAGHAYRCTCSEERVDELRARATELKQNPRYDGHCRDLGLGPDCGPHAVRFRMPQTGSTWVHDLVKGSVEFDNQELDDLVIQRADGMPIYNFVVVVDDVDMKISHVLRGDDHLNNTPKQINIYLALGAEPPAFGHMPLILGPDGSRLSKRHGATSLGAYRELGLLPEAMLNYLARLGWSAGDQEVFSKDELIAAFSVDGIGVSGGRWDMEKLSWLNQVWMKRLPLEELAARAVPYFVAAGLSPDERLPLVVGTLRERTRSLVELAAAARFYYADDYAVDAEAVAKFLGAASAPLLTGLADALEGAGAWDAATLEVATNAWLAAAGLKLGKVAQPARVALSGQKTGPGLFETLAALGRDRSLARLRAGAAQGS